MNHSVEEWDRQARHSHHWAVAARAEAERRSRGTRFRRLTGALIVVAAVLLLILLGDDPLLAKAETTAWSVTASWYGLPKCQERSQKDD